jgi:hypothetical protein
MGKNRDLIQILLIILIGMFIPFLGAMTITYGFNLYRISSSFGYFLVIFGIELAIVYLYFFLTNWSAQKKLKQFQSRKDEETIKDK